MAVTLYRSTDPSAPVLTGLAGSGIALLDACLVNGYGSKAALGWQKVFSATNVAVYRSLNNVSNRFYLRVDETGGTSAAFIRGYETMSDANTGTGPFPTVAAAVNGWCYRKSNTADATARTWALWGDDKTFYMNMQASATAYDVPVIGFGHFISLRPGDGFNTFIGGNFNNTAGGPGSTQSNGFGIGPVFQGGSSTFQQGNGLTMARSYHQTGGGINTMLTTAFAYNTNNSTAMAPPGVSGYAGTAFNFPNFADLGFYVGTIYLPDGVNGGGTVCLRGRLPGMYAPLANPSASQYDQYSGLIMPDGSTINVMMIYSGFFQSLGYFAVDINGPWN